MARTGRRRTAPSAPGNEPDGTLDRAISLVWALPPFSGLVLWLVSGSLALGLGFLGLGLAGVGFLLARFYGLQLEVLERE